MMSMVAGDRLMGSLEAKINIEKRGKLWDFGCKEIEWIKSMNSSKWCRKY